jgi:hypothetical protein
VEPVGFALETSLYAAQVIEAALRVLDYSAGFLEFETDTIVHGPTADPVSYRNRNRPSARRRIVAWDALKRHVSP